jgi:hypothetical protein
MSDLNMVDMTGKPRSDRDLEEALQVVKKFLVKGFLSLPPELALQLTSIHAFLKELQVYRNAIAQAKAKEPSPAAPEGSA